MSLRLKLVLLTSGLGIAVLAVVLSLVNQKLTCSFTTAARVDAELARAAVRGSLDVALDTHRVRGQIVSNETLLKEALLKQSTELAFTYADSARDRAATEYLFVLDEGGRLVADGRGKLTPGTPLPVPDFGDRDVARRARTGFMMLDGTLVAAAIVPVVLGERVVGHVVLGDRVSSEALATTQRGARTDVTLVSSAGERIASTLGDQSAREVLRQAGACSGEPRDIEVRGQPHLLLGEALVAMTGERLGCMVVTRSLEAQMTELRSLQRWLLGLGAAITALAIAAAAAMSYRLVRPIHALTAASLRIARGDLSSRELTASGRDEVGQMASAFNRMLASLRELARLAGRMASGDLTMHVETSGELGHAFNRMLSAQRSMVSEIADAVVQLAGAAGEIYAATQQQEGAATHQASGVEEVSRTVQSLLDSAGFIAESARGVLSNAERTREMTASVAARIAELGTYTGRIAEVLDAIREIAERSDLLALNASIEATRAGEAGRPFGLVAAEMRRLAERVTGSVGDVRTLLADIRGSGAATALATEEGRKIAESTTESARQITRVTQQQSTATEQVLQSTRHIAAVVSESAAATQQTRASARILKDEADRLNTLVGRFVTAQPPPGDEGRSSAREAD